MTETAVITNKRRLTTAFQRLMSIHWWMALCYLVLFVGGAFMARLDRQVFFRGGLYDVHKSIGVLALALLSWRVIVLLQVWWKKYSKRWPKRSSKWWQSAVLHASLYSFMVSVPVAGLLFSNSFKANNVKFFGLPVPDLFPEDKAMVEYGRSLHLWLAYIFLGFIFLHAVMQWKSVRAYWRRFLAFMSMRAGMHRSAGSTDTHR
jgi:cytochrome b561